MFLLLLLCDRFRCEVRLVLVWWVNFVVVLGVGRLVLIVVVEGFGGGVFFCLYVVSSINFSLVICICILFF